MAGVVSVIQWLVAEVAMWFIAGLLPDKALGVLRAVGGVVIGIGVFLLLLGGTIALAVEDDWIVLFGLVVGIIGFLFMVLGAGLRTMGNSDAGVDMFDVVNSL